MKGFTYKADIQVQIIIDLCRRQEKMEDTGNLQTR